MVLLELSNCTNPIVDNSINGANENIAKGEDPTESLNSVTDVLKENEMASGNVVQLDQTIKLAIEKQAELLLGIANPNTKDSSSKNFTKSVVDVNNELLKNELAFWGLEPIARSEALGQVQKNIDDTLFLLADYLIDGIYKNNDNPNIGNSEKKYSLKINFCFNFCLFFFFQISF